MTKDGGKSNTVLIIFRCRGTSLAMVCIGATMCKNSMLKEYLWKSKVLFIIIGGIICHDTRVEVKGVGSLLPLCVSGVELSPSHLHSESSYPLSHWIPSPPLLNKQNSSNLLSL